MYAAMFLMTPYCPKIRGVVGTSRQSRNKDGGSEKGSFIFGGNESQIALVVPPEKAQTSPVGTTT